MGRRHQEDVRLKIQAGQLINVLEKHALGKDEKELSSSRLKAIEILLRKSVPDLSAVTLSGDEKNPLIFKQIECVIVDPANSGS